MSILARSRYGHAHVLILPIASFDPSTAFIAVAVDKGLVHIVGREEADAKEADWRWRSVALQARLYPVPPERRQLDVILKKYGWRSASRGPPCAENIVTQADSTMTAANAHLAVQPHSCKGRCALVYGVVDGRVA